MSVDGCWIWYWGTPADLIAAGCATAEMCAAGRSGRPRFTAHGHSFGRHSIDAKGRVQVWYRSVPADFAQTLPGVPRSWHSTIAALLPISDQARAEFEAEGGHYLEAGAW